MKKKLSLVPIVCCFSVVSTAYATNSFLEKKSSSNTSMDFFLQAGSQGIVPNDQNSGNLTDDDLKYPVLFNLGYTYDYNKVGSVEMELVESDIAIQNNKYSKETNQVVLQVEPNKVTYITPILKLKLFAKDSEGIYICKFKYPIKIKTDSTNVIATSVDTGTTLFTRGITLDVDYLDCDNSGRYRSVYLETTGAGNRYFEFTPNNNAYNVEICVDPSSKRQFIAYSGDCGKWK